jgi:hypothetical protein
MFDEELENHEVEFENPPIFDEEIYSEEEQILLPKDESNSQGIVAHFEQYSVTNIPQKILQLLSNISNVALEVVSPDLSLVESKVQSFLTSNFQQ